jgi:hypothetical protein
MKFQNLFDIIWQVFFQNLSFFKLLMAKLANFFFRDLLATLIEGKAKRLKIE